MGGGKELLSIIVPVVVVFVVVLVRCSQAVLNILVLVVTDWYKAHSTLRGSNLKTQFHSENA